MQPSPALLEWDESWTKRSRCWKRRSPDTSTRGVLGSGVTGPEMGVSPGLAPSHNACPSPRPRGQTSGGEAPGITAGSPQGPWLPPLWAHGVWGGGARPPHPPHFQLWDSPASPNQASPASPSALKPTSPAPGHELLGQNWKAPHYGWSSPLALRSGQELGGTAGPNFLLTSRYSRSVSFSSGEVLRIWNQGEQGGRGSAKAKRYWEDPGEEGVRRPTLGPGPRRHLPWGLRSLQGLGGP